MLSGLSSLMEDEDDDRRGGLIFNLENFSCDVMDVIPHFAHSSLSDYLLDSSRSGPFHVNLQEYENQLTTRSFALIIQVTWARGPLLCTACPSSFF